MYMSEPLSATISPYFCIARKIFCTFGSLVRWVMSTPGLQAQPGAHRQSARQWSRRDATPDKHNRWSRAPSRETRDEFRTVGIVNFVVAHESGKNRQASRIRRCPGIGPPVVRVHVEECARTGEPFCLVRCCRRRCKARKDNCDRDRRSTDDDPGCCADRRCRDRRLRSSRAA